MTTHDMQPTETPRETVDDSGSFETPPAETADRPMETADRPMETADVPMETAAPTPAPGPTPPADSGDQTLFADGELLDLRSRWTEVQSAFVDDPRDCVQKADGLVADVVDKLTTGFSGARAHLEEQWARGEQVSTEDLRIALTRYREFFERLLAV